MMLRNVKFMSRSDAKKLIPNSKSAIISISVPDDPAPLDNGWSTDRVLRLQFHDADSDQILSTLGRRTKSYISIHGRPILFSENQAKDVINFVEHLKYKVDTIFVHCDAGISRSAAVAKFIADMYKLPFPESYMLYNKYVYRMLAKTYHNMMYGD